MRQSVKMASKREAVTVFGVGQHVVAAEEEETKEILAGDVENSIELDNSPRPCIPLLHRDISDSYIRVTTLTLSSEKRLNTTIPMT